MASSSSSSSTTTIAATFFLSMLLINLIQSHQTVAVGTDGGLKSPLPSPTPKGALINCDAECGRRCSATSRPNRCNRACLACCHTCNCVPPGTSGNKDVCPCYANLLNPKTGVHKCP